MIDVALTTFTDVADVVPNDTVAPLEKPLPEIETFVPPATGPDEGPIDDTAGGGAAGVSYRNPPESLPLCPSGFVTTMSAVPAAWAGVVAVIEVALTTAMLVAGEPPIETDAPAVKLLPLIVTPRPPLVAPNAGVTPASDGAAAAGGDGDCGDDGPDGDEPPPHEVVRIVSTAHATNVTRTADFC